MPTRYTVSVSDEDETQINHCRSEIINFIYNMDPEAVRSIKFSFETTQAVDMDAEDEAAEPDIESELRDFVDDREHGSAIMPSTRRRREAQAEADATEEEVQEEIIELEEIDLTEFHDAQMTDYTSDEPPTILAILHQTEGFLTTSEIRARIEKRGYEPRNLSTVLWKMSEEKNYIQKRKINEDSNLNEYRITDLGRAQLYYLADGDDPGVVLA